MKNIGPGAIIGAIVVVIALIGFVAYQFFFSDPNYTPIKGAAAEKAYDDAKAKDRDMYKRVRAEEAAKRTQ